MWWSWGDSNPLPLECHSSALPDELQPLDLNIANDEKLGKHKVIDIIAGYYIVWKSNV